MSVTITIRHVPEHVRNELAARAARRGRSLQEYMLAQAVRLASKPTVDDWLDEVRDRKASENVRLDRDVVLADRDADRR